jgi:putative transposase
MHNSCANRSAPPWRAANRQPTAGGGRLPDRPRRGDRRTRQPGYDAGKKINGRKRHIAVDTCGLLLAILVTGANVQDRDAARPLLGPTRRLPHLRSGLGRGRYAGKLVNWATECLALTVQIVAKLAGQTTFVVLPRRWCVERTFSWINRCRRTVRDYERRPDHHAAMVRWAMIIIMARRLARHQPT